MIRPLARAAFALTLALGLAGCSGDTGTVARVGNEAITTGDYYAAARGAGDQYPPAPDAAKAMLLEDLVRRRLLLLAARERGIFADTLVARFRQVKEEELLTQALSRSLAPASVGVSEAEIRQFYANRDSAAHVQLIYAFTEHAAQSAADQARAGGDFGQIADRFNPPGMLPAGGDIGTQAPGNMVPPLDDYLLSAPVGSIVGPLNSPTQGWFVMKILTREPRAQGPYETERAQLGEMLRQRKQRAIALKSIARLRRAYHLRLEPGAGQTIFMHFNRNPDPLSQPPSNYTPEQRARVLARWDAPDGAHTYTFDQALTDLDTGSRDKPNAMILPAIEQWIQLEVTRRIQVAEARHRGYGLDPNWQRQLDETVNNYVLEAVYQQEVLLNAQSLPGDAREVYERNKSRFERLSSVKVQTITFPDSASAVAFTTHAGHSKSLQEAAAMVAGAPPVEAIDVRYPAVDPIWQQLQPSFAAMSPGDAAGPFPTARGWTIAMVMAKETSVTPFEALDPGARGMLEQEGLEIARERKLMSMIEDLRRKHPVVIDEAVVKKLPWPVKAARAS